METDGEKKTRRSRRARGSGGSDAERDKRIGGLPPAWGSDKEEANKIQREGTFAEVTKLNHSFAWEKNGLMIRPAQKEDAEPYYAQIDDGAGWPDPRRKCDQ